MCYFSNALQYPTETIDTICHALNDPKFGRVDFIVGTGISGVLILVPVSMKSGIPCGAVRKMMDVARFNEDGGSHSETIIETYLPKGHKVYRYVIIDDLIESGKTICHIKGEMKTHYAHVQCTGIILYQNNDYDQTRIHYGIPVTSSSQDIVELNALRLIEQPCSIQ